MIDPWSDSIEYRASFQIRPTTQASSSTSFLGRCTTLVLTPPGAADQARCPSFDASSRCCSIFIMIEPSRLRR